MSKIMLKMLADMAGITPDEIAANVEAFQELARNGVGQLESINARLGAIERHLGISPAEITDETERQDNGEEKGT